MAFNKPSDRRIFLTANNIDYFKIFSFSQRKDGDIYCHWQNFSKTKWFLLLKKEDQIILDVHDTPEDSQKLSIHRSGVAKFRQNDPSFDPTRIFGSHLINYERNEVGVRHLFTSFICEPNDLSITAPFGSRKSDVSILSKKFEPFVIAFFAIPQQPIPIKTSLSIKANTDLFENTENFMVDVGCDLFSLGYHDIIWLTFSTKMMKKWPKMSFVSYQDGFSVPLFIGLENEDTSKKFHLNFSLLVPNYQFKNNELIIELEFPNPENLNFK